MKTYVRIPALWSIDLKMYSNTVTDYLLKYVTSNLLTVLRWDKTRENKYQWDTFYFKVLFVRKFHSGQTLTFWDCSLVGRRSKSREWDSDFPNKCVFLSEYKFVGVTMLCVILKCCLVCTFPWIQTGISFFFQNCNPVINLIFFPLNVSVIQLHPSSITFTEHLFVYS